MGISVPATTLAGVATLSGAGLHSGLTTNVRLCPAAPGSGIVFVRTDLPGRPRANCRSCDHNAPPFRTVIKNGAAEVHTVEHLLSALAAHQITDCEIEIDGLEIPGLDGSARLFAEAIQNTGTRSDASAQVAVITLSGPITLVDGAARIEAHPHDGLRLTYTIDYPGHPLAQGTFSIDVTPETFRREIAPARTFAMKKDAEIMRAAGLGKGANYENTVVVDGAQALHTTLRFENEPVRHKILDLLGDLYVLGRPLHAHVVARCSGHKINRALAMRIGELYP